MSILGRVSGPFPDSAVEVQNSRDERGLESLDGNDPPGHYRRLSKRL